MATHLTEPASRATFMAFDRTPCRFMCDILSAVFEVFFRGFGWIGGSHTCWAGNEGASVSR